MLRQPKVEAEHANFNAEQNFKNLLNQVRSEGDVKVSYKSDKNIKDPQKNDADMDHASIAKNAKQEHKNEKYKQSDCHSNCNNQSEVGKPDKSTQEMTSVSDESNEVIKNESKDETDQLEEKNIIENLSAESNADYLQPYIGNDIDINPLLNTVENTKTDVEMAVVSDLSNIEDGENIFHIDADTETISQSIPTLLTADAPDSKDAVLNQSANLVSVTPKEEPSLAIPLISSGNHVAVIENADVTVNAPSYIYKAQYVEINSFDGSELNSDGELVAEMKIDGAIRSPIKDDSVQNVTVSFETLEADVAPKDSKIVFEKMLQSVANFSGNTASADISPSQTVTAQSPSSSAINNASQLSMGVASFDQNLPSARSFVVQTSVPVTVGQPQWNQAVGEKVLWLASQNVSSAEIRLDPPDLGVMHVKISVNQDQASVSFTSHHPVVREALDQHMNRLRDMFTDQGINLINVDVSDKSFSRQQGEGKEQNSDAALNEAGIEEETPAAMTILVQKRLVDHYA